MHKPSPSISFTNLPVTIKAIFMRKLFIILTSVFFCISNIYAEKVFRFGCSLESTIDGMFLWYDPMKDGNRNPEFVKQGFKDFTFTPKLLSDFYFDVRRVNVASKKNGGEALYSGAYRRGVSVIKEFDVRLYCECYYMVCLNSRGKSQFDCAIFIGHNTLGTKV